jgi:hypothetical protein
MTGRIMGIVWFPCRVEPGIGREEIDRLVRIEARMFLAAGGRLTSELERLVKFTEPEREEIARAYREAGRLDGRLLFKRTSHHVYAITDEELFPLEWRMDAYRTFPPWELPGQVETWQAYRAQVARGGHRASLLRLLLYLRSNALADYFRGSLIGAAERSLAATSSWARQPEFGAIRDRILTTPCPEVLAPPVWQELADQPLWHAPAADGQFQELRNRYEQVAELAKTWNATVQRGNRRVELPLPFPDLEEWIARRFADDRYARFLTWLEPWVRGGYGLYRDCE